MPGSQTATRLAAMSGPHGARRRVEALVVVLVLLAGCGSQAATPTKPPDPAKAEVALLQAPKRAGEIIVRGDLSPASHGPYDFDGRYVVRFEQFAPEDPNVDFASQTAFVATLDREAEVERSDTVKLFRTARKTGRRTVTLHGRLYVDVSFGDFPYAIRFTPAR
jgi:hypothetical protein